PLAQRVQVPGTVVGEEGGVQPVGREQPGVERGGLAQARPGRGVGGRQHLHRHAGRPRARHHRRTVGVELRGIQVAVRIDQHRAERWRRASPSITSPDRSRAGARLRREMTIAAMPNSSSSTKGRGSGTNMLATNRPAATRNSFGYLSRSSQRITGARTGLDTGGVSGRIACERTLARAGATWFMFHSFRGPRIGHRFRGEVLESRYPPRHTAVSPPRSTAMKNNTLAIALASLLVGGVAVAAFQGNREDAPRTDVVAAEGAPALGFDEADIPVAGRLEYASVLSVEPVTEREP